MILNMTGKGGGGTILVSDTQDAAGGTIRTITAKKVVSLQTKTITPTSSVQTVNPDTGYDGFSQVTVNASGSSATIQSLNVTPSTSEQTFNASGVDGYKPVVVAAMPTMTLPTSAAASATSGYTSKATISRSTSDQYINIPTGYNSAGGYYKISAVANGSATGPSSLSSSSATITTGTNTITLTKTGVTTTPTVSAGYVSSATASTATVALTASVTVNPTPTASGKTVTIPAGYYSAQTTKDVSTGSATAPSTISGTAASVSTGTNTLTLTKTVSVTPTVSAGYVSSGTAGNASVSLTASVTTKAAATITPGTTNQTIASGTYLTGTQTIAGDANLTAGNIKKDVTIFGTTGTYEGSGEGGGSSMVVATATKTLTSAASSISFTGLSGEPTSFAVTSSADQTTGGTKVVAVTYDGTNLYGIDLTTQAANDTGFTQSYSNGTLTITATTASFQANEYKLVYSYGGTAANIGGGEVQVGSGATSITFTGLEDEPEYFSCIFKSTFSTSSGYQRTMEVVYDGTSTYGHALDSSAHALTSWSYTYNSGSLTISSTGTNNGGYFHQPGYYQLIYAIGGDSSFQKKTVTPTSSDQTIIADTAQGYTALSQVKVEGVTCSNLTAANIKSGVIVKIGTDTDDDSVTSVTGTYSGGGGSSTVATKTTTNNSNTATTLSFTSMAGEPIAFFVRLTTQIARSSNNRYYYVENIRYNGTDTTGRYFYQSSGTLTNSTTHYSYSYSGTTLTLTSTGSRSAAGGSFYNGDYELVYIY